MDTTATPRAPSTRRSPVPAGSPQAHALFQVDHYLITDVEVGIIFHLGETSLSELLIGSPHDGLVHQLIRHRPARNFDPLVGLVCREIGVVIVVKVNILA